MRMSIEKVKFLASKHSPEILLGVGITAVIGGVVLACQRSRRLDRMAEAYVDDVETIKSESDCIIFNCDVEPVDEEERNEMMKRDPNDPEVIKIEKEERRAIRRLKAEFALEYVRMYAAPVILIGGGLGLIIYGNRILNKRNAQLLAAYGALEETLKEYRSRVRERYGEKIENDIFTGRTYETITDEVVDENGKKKKVKTEVPGLTDSISTYADIFDVDTSTEYYKSFEMNRTFLRCQQNSANDKLRRDGFLFLNAVREMLGMHPTSTGAVCGWILPKDGEIPEGDDFVDFGMVEDSENGRILLNFNCQGLIYDKID